MDVNAIIDKIVETNTRLAKFWSHSHGWAPNYAADLMSASRLDRQVSLSMTLKIWVKDKNNPLSDGELILAWSNLGSLVEGTLKLFFSVYYGDYCNDIRAIKDRETSQIIDPDVLTLEPLKVILYKSAGFEKEWFDLVDLIQRRRNAIHAYQDKEIGNTDEFYNCLEKYLEFIDEVDSRFPYP